MGASDFESLGRLSIGGAEGRVWTFAGLGDVADPAARQFGIYGEHAEVFSAGAEVLPPTAWERGDLPVLEG